MTNKVFASGQAIPDASIRGITPDLTRLVVEPDAKTKNADSMQSIGELNPRLIKLQKGQEVIINSPRLIIGMGWTPIKNPIIEDLIVDATACMLRENLKIPSADYFVYYNNFESPDKSCCFPDDECAYKCKCYDEFDQILFC